MYNMSSKFLQCNNEQRGNFTHPPSNYVTVYPRQGDGWTRSLTYVTQAGASPEILSPLTNCHNRPPCPLHKVLPSPPESTRVFVPLPQLWAHDELGVHAGQNTCSSQHTHLIPFHLNKWGLHLRHLFKLGRWITHTFQCSTRLSYSSLERTLRKNTQKKHFFMVFNSSPNFRFKISFKVKYHLTNYIFYNFGYWKGNKWNKFL